MFIPYDDRRTLPSWPGHWISSINPPATLGPGQKDDVAAFVELDALAS
jgi:hypothetical protein